MKNLKINEFQVHIKVVQTYIYLFVFRFFSFIGCYGISSVVPYACSRSLLVIYFIYITVYLLVLNSSFTPPPTFFNSLQTVTVQQGEGECIDILIEWCLSFLLVPLSMSLEE